MIFSFKALFKGQLWWLTPVIPATRKADGKMAVVRDWPQQKHELLPEK
jgi:hypothetical protein